MNTSKFSNILLDKSPKKINNITEKILDTLFTINEVVRELNSIDFCNPLGYILTKAFPPDGLVDNLLQKYSKKVTDFINQVTTKLELNNNTNELSDNIEEIRLLLEELILPEQLKDIIPGADGLTKVIQDLNDSLVITNTLISVNDKKLLIKSFSNRLLPFSNPINLTEALLANKKDSLNKQLRDIIKPERFRADLLRLIKLVIKIDKSIKQIQNIVILTNKIIKSINVLIKIFLSTAKILKKTPTPAKYVTVGLTVTSSSKVSKLESDAKELQKLLDSVSTFLKTSVIQQIKRIREEIFILLVGLNQLYENLLACKYFEGDILLDTIQQGITNLNDNINTLNELFPEINYGVNNRSYKGYTISILKEETSDNNTSLIRRRIIVTNSNNIIEYESTPTYSNDDQILIKEGQYYIDLKEEIDTSDNGTNTITDEENEIILNQIGLSSSTLDEATVTENKVNELLQIQIQNNPQERELFNYLNPPTDINQNKVIQIKKIINNITINYNSPAKIILLQTRLNRLNLSLQSKGYTPEEIDLAFRSSNLSKYNIKIINNNITISRN